MKYMDYTAYKKLTTQTNQITWAIYLPAKQGAAQTSSNSSLLHNATSLLKETLATDGTPKKQASNIIANLRDKSKDFLHPLKGAGVLVLIYKDGSNSLWDLPINIDSGFITDLKELFLKPVADFYNQDESYYFLDLHQNGCRLYEWNREGIKAIDDAELQKDLGTALMLDEAALKSIQTHRLSNMNDGIQEGVHGQGGYKDRHKEYVKQYLQFIDKQLSKYSHQTIKPIVLVGSKQLIFAFKKISHNKRLIKGYMANLPSNFDLSLLNTQLVKY